MPLTDEKSKNYRKRWLLSVAVAVAVLAAGEIACRLWDAYDAWAKYQTFLTKVVTYRDQVYSISKPQDTQRILLLGGSAAYDTVDRAEDSWPYFLEQNLKTALRGNVEVINMAYYSESSIDELFKLHQFGLALDPDLVIVFDGNNDVYNLWKHYDYWRRLYEVKAKAILSPKKRHHFLTELRNEIRNNSALYQRINRGISWVQRQLSLLAMKIQESRTVSKPQNEADAVSEDSGSKQPDESPVPQDPFKDVGQGPGSDAFEEDGRREEIMAAHREIYGANLDKIARLTQQAGAKVLFIFQPDLSYRRQLTGSESEAERGEYLSVIQGQNERWQKIIAEAYPAGVEIMRTTAERYGIPFDDFNRIFTENPSRDFSSFFSGNVHFEEEGRRAVAQRITELILQNGLLENNNF